MKRNKKKLFDELSGKLTSCDLVKEVPLSEHTQLKIGGPAEFFCEVKSRDDLVHALKVARNYSIPVTIIGRGTNILVSDEGVKGLVIKNSTNDIEIVEDDGVSCKGRTEKMKPKARWTADAKRGTFKGDFNDLDYSEEGLTTKHVRVDSGVDLPLLINKMLKNGLTGLQWYSGIPGTIGGAVYNNIHGGTHFIYEVIDTIEVIGPDNKVRRIKSDELQADYNFTKFQKSKDVILRVKFCLYAGDAQKAQKVVAEWAKRKSHQPRNSPGCAFSNISEDQKSKYDFPTTSVGYIVEHELEMSGFNIGDAAISRDHHNFIVNQGNATALDYLSVMKEIYSNVKEKFGIELKPEIFLVGFSSEEAKPFKVYQPV